MSTEMLFLAGIPALLVTLCMGGWLATRNEDGPAGAGRFELRLEEERRARRRAEQALADAHEVLCRLVRQHEGVRDGERGRIARDLHEQLGRTLLAMRVELSLLHVSTRGVHPGLHGKLGAMTATVDQALRSLRAAVHDLRPLGAGEDLRAAFDRHLSEFARMHALGYRLDFGPGVFDKRPGDPELDALLYRALQEALSNVARHAHASEVRVRLTRDGDRLLLRVADNGIGIAPPAPSGRGLAAVRDRAAVAGGSLTLESRPAGGAELLLTLPLEAWGGQAASAAFLAKNQ